MIQIGLAFASSAGIQLNMNHKDRDMVGLGSYLVNVAGDCNGCHTHNPANEYTTGGNPYLLRPVFNGTKKIDSATYLGGGSVFGPLPGADGAPPVQYYFTQPDTRRALDALKAATRCRISSKSCGPE